MTDQEVLEKLDEMKARYNSELETTRNELQQIIQKQNMLTAREHQLLGALHAVNTINGLPERAADATLHVVEKDSEAIGEK